MKICVEWITKKKRNFLTRPRFVNPSASFHVKDNIPHEIASKPNIKLQKCSIT